MAQIFPRSFNWFSKISIVAVLFLLGAIGFTGFAMTQSDYWTNANVARTQPIQFSHAHHVNGLGIDCRYCHTTVENSNFAGIPPTKTCMNCHQQIWTGAPMLEPVRESYKLNKALEWDRIHKLGDFVYFDHSIHVNNGVGCATCHGRIDHMQAVYQKNSLLMNWCLECHRAPEKFVRPKDQVFNHGWDFTLARQKGGEYYGTADKVEAEIAAFSEKLPANLSAEARKEKIKEFSAQYSPYSSQEELGRALIAQGPVGPLPGPAVQSPGIDLAGKRSPADSPTQYRLRNVLECSGCHR
jgi:hypothetical protein